jgi:hypothetical protein
VAVMEHAIDKLMIPSRNGTTEYRLESIMFSYLFIFRQVRCVGKPNLLLWRSVDGQIHPGLLFGEISQYLIRGRINSFNQEGRYAAKNFYRSVRIDIELFY